MQFYHPRVEGTEPISCPGSAVEMLCASVCTKNDNFRYEMISDLEISHGDSPGPYLGQGHIKVICRSSTSGEKMIPFRPKLNVKLGKPVPATWRKSRHEL